ncbi:MAG: hypothetical protein ACSLFF_08925 [Solirubrobacterales bacterium]
MTEKTTTGRLISAAGGLLLIISLFLSWYGFEASGPAGQFAASFATSFSAWDAFDIASFVFLIVGLLAIAPAAFDIFDLEIELPFDIAFVALVGGAISVLWIVFRMFEKPGPDIPDIAGSDIGIGLKFGIFIGLIGAALIVFGGIRQKGEDDAAAGYEQAAYAQPVAPAAPPQAAPPTASPTPQAPPPGQPPQPPAPPEV